MKVGQCFYGIDKRGDAGILAHSGDLTNVDFSIVAEFTRMPIIQEGYDKTLTVFPLSRGRIAVMCSFEDHDPVGRQWPFCHILVFKNDNPALGGILSGNNPGIVFRFSINTVGSFSIGLHDPIPLSRKSM